MARGLKARKQNKNLYWHYYLDLLLFETTHSVQNFHLILFRVGSEKEGRKRELSVAKWQDSIKVENLASEVGGKNFLGCLHYHWT